MHTRSNMFAVFAVLALASALISCDDPPVKRTTGERCVELSECPRLSCNCGDGERAYAVCEEGRCAKDCDELCRSRARL